MSGSNRVNVSKTGLIIGLLLALAICFGWIGYGLSKSAEYERQADNQRTEYSEYTRHKIAETCVGIPDLEAVKCRYEAFDAQREQSNNQSDLVAQRQSALWAYIMGAAAVIGMALSAVGVWLVKTTFDETRLANILSKSQQRGRIELDFQGRIGNETGNLIIAIRGRNIGHSAATNCWISMDVGVEVPHHFVAGIPRLERQTIGAQADVTLLTYRRPDRRIEGYYLWGVVVYACIFGDQHKTHFCVRILPAPTIPDHTNRNLINAVPCKPAHWVDA
jgi:hypothetical protein